MADALIIEYENATAGIAVRERGGFTFYASDVLFWNIDQYKFPSLKTLHSRIRHIVHSGPNQVETQVATKSGERMLPPPPSDSAAFVDCIYV
jgi:hypothetical protein